LFLRRNRGLKGLAAGMAKKLPYFEEYLPGERGIGKRREQDSGGGKLDLRRIGTEREGVGAWWKDTLST